MLEVISAVFGSGFALRLRWAGRTVRRYSVVYGLVIPAGSLITHSRRTNGPSESIGGGAR